MVDDSIHSHLSGAGTMKGANILNHYEHCKTRETFNSTFYPSPSQPGIGVSRI
jgi:hypothetical protein